LEWGALVNQHRATLGASAGPGWNALRSNCPEGARVMVWGWAAELYSYNDWTPASRYVDSTWQLEFPSKRAVYLRRLEMELAARPPACIIEAVGPAFFGGFGVDRTMTATLPVLSGFLGRCYARRVIEQSSSPELLNQISSAELTYYVRKNGCA
jgi:hypothetical protein